MLEIFKKSLEATIRNVTNYFNNLDKIVENTSLYFSATPDFNHPIADVTFNYRDNDTNIDIWMNTNLFTDVDDSVLSITIFDDNSDNNKILATMELAKTYSGTPYIYGEHIDTDNEKIVGYFKMIKELVESGDK